MGKRLIVVAWVLVIVSMIGLTAYADTVIPKPVEKKHDCGMYCDENGITYWPEECTNYHSVMEMKRGDRIIFEDGSIATIHQVSTNLAIEDWVVELGIFNADGTPGENYEEYKDMLAGIPYSEEYLVYGYGPLPE